MSGSAIASFHLAAPFVFPVTSSALQIRQARGNVSRGASLVAIDTDLAMALASGKVAFDLRLEEVTRRVQAFLARDDGSDDDEATLQNYLLLAAKSAASDPEHLSFADSLLDRILRITGDMQPPPPRVPGLTALRTETAATTWREARAVAAERVGDVVCALRSGPNPDLRTLSDTLEVLLCELVPDSDSLSGPLEELRKAVAHNELEPIQRYQQQGVRLSREWESFLDKNTNLMKACECFPEMKVISVVAPLTQALLEIGIICALDGK